MKDELMSIAKPAEGRFQIICFPIGKADSFLLRTAHSALLIDTGSYSSRKQLAKWLQLLGIERLDYLISTHFDSDHIGGTAQILKVLPVYDVIQSPYHQKNQSWKEYDKTLKKYGFRPDQPRHTEEFVLDDVFYTIIPPKKEHYPEDESNNRSLIVQARHGAQSFLFMADAQNKRIQEWLECNAEHCTWLKIPYHGRYQQTLPELLHAVQPEHAVITSSDKQKEDAKTVELLWHHGCKVTLTRNGFAVFESDGKYLTKKTFT